MYSKADTHMHTTYSDGLMRPEEMVDYIATRTDLRVIAITDHDTAEGALVAYEHNRRMRYDLEVIIGQEVTTREGDVVGLFVTSTLPTYATAREAIDAIHAQGGLAVSVHPFSRISTANNMKGLGAKIFELPLDGVEVRNGFPTNLIANPMSSYLNRYRGQGLAELGGSDSHVPYTVGQAHTRFPGRSAADFRRAVERRLTEARGSFWTPLSMARMVGTMMERGWNSHVPVFNE